MSIILGYGEIESQLKKLSIPAKIAVGTRCALRVEPVAYNLTEKQREGLRMAIEALAAYAKGAQIEIPAEALKTLQQLEYTDIGADAVYAGLRPAEALSRYEIARSRYDHARSFYNHIQEIAQTWARVGWHTSPATINSLVPRTGEELSRATNDLKRAAEEFDRTTGLIDSLLVSSIDHSVAASAAGAAANGGAASTAAASAALAAACLDIETACSLNEDQIDPSESGPLGPLWPTYMPEFTIPKSKFDKYYSCFISYSSKDEAFADRLHAELQINGVRCWFAPDDFKIGDKIRPTIDDSIRAHDKLLLILSKHSIASNWVEHEVEIALAREQEQKLTLLFPIRLDDAVMEIKTGWPSHIRYTRNIGDFRQWHNDDAFKKALNRLLHDLKATEPDKP
jgi:hypothetical protein